MLSIRIQSRWILQWILHRQGDERQVSDELEKEWTWIWGNHPPTMPSNKHRSPLSPRQRKAAAVAGKQPTSDDAVPLISKGWDPRLLPQLFPPPGDAEQQPHRRTWSPGQARQAGMDSSRSADDALRYVNMQFTWLISSRYSCNIFNTPPVTISHRPRK